MVYHIQHQDKVGRLDIHVQQSILAVDDQSYLLLLGIHEDLKQVPQVYHRVYNQSLPTSLHQIHLPVLNQHLSLAITHNRLP